MKIKILIIPENGDVEIWEGWRNGYGIPVPNVRIKQIPRENVANELNTYAKHADDATETALINKLPKA